MPASYPSIFNDVIGPVMRGPSSSHCAASLRIGRMARDLMDADLEEVIIAFDPHGSLATIHQSQGTDMGLCGGLLGWQADDSRLPDSQQAIAEAGIRVKIEIAEIGTEHPNTYKLTLRNKRESHELIALSTGGGMIAVVEIDGVPVAMAGDYFETLVYIESSAKEIITYLEKRISADGILFCHGQNHRFIEIKSHCFLNAEICTALKARRPVLGIKKIAPVLPVLSHKTIKVPFVSCNQMLDYNADQDLALWELAVHYESARGDIPAEKVFEMMGRIAGILREAVSTGIAGTHYDNRILGHQAGFFKDKMAAGRLLDGGILNQMILYVTAVMEVKSSMGVIVAAPTAGSCGTLPGACLAAAHWMDLAENEIIRALLAAGIIGVFIASRATFAAEVGGCQAECGAASAMAAAALVTLAGGHGHQAVSAASMALQNVLGLICDPVANRVEVPCLGKNILAAGNALASANMALAGFDAVIPLDEVIEAMDAVGQSLPCQLRCTGLGGLSVTRTSKKIAERLDSDNKP